MVSKRINNRIELLNQTVFNVMAEEDNLNIVKKFTDQSVKIFEADLGFCWGRFRIKDAYGIAHKTKSTSFNPTFPWEIKNATENNLLIDSNVDQERYVTKIDKDIKSYIIIPIRYFDHMYGSIVVAYKEPHNFTEEEITLSDTIGNSIAQSITINWLIESERRALLFAEKQRETEILLAEEKQKTEFIANITHEVRTPLSIMRGYVDLALRNKKDVKGAIETLEVVKEEIIHLAQMFSDLVLITSRNHKNLIFEFGMVDIGKTILDITKRLKGIASEKRINIEVKGKKEKVLVHGDKKYLDRTFLNLIENAITYGKSKISIDISNLKGKIIIKISDNGVGISEEDLPHIFERFYRVDKAHSSSDHSGLGLSIVKRIVDMHGGKIKVESTPGKGSTFTVTLPKKDSVKI